MKLRKIEILPDLIEIAIESVAFGGDGVGRFGELVVFVPFTVDGDVITARVVSVGKRFVRARLEQILKPSPHRISPRCRHYGRCGGCQYQNIIYAHQLRIKETQTADALSRIGKVAHPPVEPAVASPKVFNYRGKADYQVQISPKVPPVIGFIDIFNESIVDIDRCEIVDETINEACLVFRESLRAGAIKKPHKRQTIWAADDADEITEVVTDFRVPRFVKRTVKGQAFSVPYRGFFQANGTLLPEMIEEVIRLSFLSGGETVVDAYCGSGLFSLFLAHNARRVYGIETDGEAIHCARLNSHQGEFTNIEFLRGDVAKVLWREFVDGRKNVDVLILDPPRAGCDTELIEAIAKLKPSKIVYVSCNPTTQARDIHRLLYHGFTLKSVKPFDMFPQTAHIEVVAFLEI